MQATTQVGKRQTVFSKSKPVKKNPFVIFLVFCNFPSSKKNQCRQNYTNEYNAQHCTSIFYCTKVCL
jgi:hypothetical protein